MRIFTSLLIALLLMATHANAQERNVPAKEIQSAAIQSTAQRALETFSQLVTKENFKQMGFDSPDEVRTAALGMPLHDYLVQLDVLKKYEPGSKTDELLTATNQIVYPILVNNQVKSSITISKTKESWQAVSFGGSSFVKMLSKTLTENSRETGLAYSAYFIVRVPSLNLFFLGYRVKDELMLVPIMDEPRLKLKAGASVKAENVFSAILPDAKAHNGLPR